MKAILLAVLAVVVASAGTLDVEEWDNKVCYGSPKETIPIAIGECMNSGQGTSYKFNVEPASGMCANLTHFHTAGCTDPFLTRLEKCQECTWSPDPKVGNYRVMCDTKGKKIVGSIGCDATCTTCKGSITAKMDACVKVDVEEPSYIMLVGFVKCPNEIKQRIWPAKDCTGKEQPTYTRWVDECDSDDSGSVMWKFKNTTI